MNDTFDYFSGTGIYHKPFYDGHQHCVAGQKLTTRELCIAVKTIIEKSPFLIYLDYEEDVITRYFISWYLLNPDDVPFYVWVDEEMDSNGLRKRKLFYETFSGALKKLEIGRDVDVPKEVHNSTQSEMIIGKIQKEKVQYVPLKYCMMYECGKVAKHQVTMKSGMSIDVCQECKIGVDESTSKEILRKKERKKRSYSKLCNPRSNNKANDERRNAKEVHFSVHLAYLLEFRLWHIPIIV